MSRYVCAASVIALATAALTASGQAQDTTVSEIPDLGGIWTNASLTKLERPGWVEGLVLTPEEVARIEGRIAGLIEAGNEDLDPDAPPPDAADGSEGDVGAYDRAWFDFGTRVAILDGEPLSSWVVDPPTGRLPYSKEGLNTFRAARAAANGFDGPEVRGPADRCLMGSGGSHGPPMMNAAYNNNYLIMQGEDTVLILSEMIHTPRVVRLGGEHKPDGVHHWAGDSVGHYEDGALVVRTTNFHPESGFRQGAAMYISPDATVTERFSRLDDATLLYEFEIDDPDIYRRVWKGRMPLRAAEGPIYEYACHEANYSLRGILAGQRREERLVQQGAQQEEDG